MSDDSLTDERLTVMPIFARLAKDTKHDVCSETIEVDVVNTDSGKWTSKIVRKYLEQVRLFSLCG